MTEEEKNALASDYVLGLLDGPDREQFEILLHNNSSLAARVDRLMQHLEALDATATPISVQPGLWSRIEQQIDSLPNRPAASFPASATRSPPQHGASPFRRQNLFWLPIAASVLLSAGLGFLAGSVPRTAPEPVVIAVLVHESDGTPGAVVEAFSDDSVTISPLENFSVPDGRILQVWTLPDVATGPVSLGTLPETRRVHLSGPALPIPHGGQLYEITLEPAPGSPTGRPTGPIVVKGFAAGIPR